MSVLNPKREPNRWLEVIMLDLLRQNTYESKQHLAEAIKVLTAWIEPGSIDDLFAPWIDQYMELLDEYENNRSIDLLMYSPKDPLECNQKSNSPRATDRLDKADDTNKILSSES